MKRKEFLKKSVFFGAGSMFLPTLSGYSTVNNSASNQINIGAIGINGMGWGNVQTKTRSSHNVLQGVQEYSRILKH